MAIEGFLNNLSKEIGFKFGTPWRYSDKALGVVVPILRQDRVDAERVYITLEEAKNQGITFKDTGRIDRVILETPSRKPIFVRSGTALKSVGTQPRAVETSVVIVPQEEKDKTPVAPIITKQEIPVRCIYSSKPISSSTKFEYGGFVPLEVGNALMSRSGQAATWNAVSSSAQRLMSHHSYASSSGRVGRGMMSGRVATDDLVGVMEDVDRFTTNIDEILAKVPLFEDQVGAVFLDMKDVVGLELFDHPKSWEAIHKEVEKRLGESLAKEEEKTFFKPDYQSIKPITLAFLKKLLESEKIETSHGITSTITLKGDGVIGEATTIDGKVIHLIGMKDSKKNKENMRPENVIRDMAQMLQRGTGDIQSYSHTTDARRRGDPLIM